MPATISATSIVSSSVTRQTVHKTRLHCDLPTHLLISLPPPWHDNGLEPDQLQKRDILITCLFNSFVHMALRPVFYDNDFPVKTLMYGSASMSTFRLFQIFLACVIHVLALFSQNLHDLLSGQRTFLFS